MQPAAIDTTVRDHDPKGPFVMRFLKALGIAICIFAVGLTLHIIFDNLFGRILGGLSAVLAIGTVMGDWWRTSTYRANCPYCGLSTRTETGSWEGVVKCSHCKNKSVQCDRKLSKTDK